MAVPRPRESLYFIYPTHSLGFTKRKYKAGQYIRQSQEDRDTSHSTKNPQQTAKHEIKTQVLSLRIE